MHQEFGNKSRINLKGKVQRTRGLTGGKNCSSLIRKAQTIRTTFNFFQ